MAVFILFLVLSLMLFGVGIYLYNSAEEHLGVLSSVLGLVVLTLSITLFTVYNNEKAKVTALVESGKYEIVTNDDYSLNELKQFKNIGSYYLKEVDE